MKLKDLRQWVNEIPKELDEYFLVYREASEIDDENKSIYDTQVIGGYADHEENKIALIDRETHNLLSGDLTEE